VLQSDNCSIAIIRINVFSYSFKIKIENVLLLSTLSVSCYVLLYAVIFTALHWMQGGLVTIKLSVLPSVGPPVWLSVKRMICDKTKNLVPTFLYHIKEHLS